MKKIDVSIKYIVLDEPAKKFLQSLKAMRKKAGLTQQALADAVSIDSQSISYYENGHRLPLIATLNNLAEYFGYDLSESLNYKLYHGEISRAWMHAQLVRYGFTYVELAKLTGYSQRSVRDCFKLHQRATLQCLHAVLEVLERERQTYNFTAALIRKGEKYKHEG